MFFCSYKVLGEKCLILDMGKWNFNGTKYKWRINSVKLCQWWGLCFLASCLEERVHCGVLTGADLLDFWGLEVLEGILFISALSLSKPRSALSCLSASVFSFLIFAYSDRCCFLSWGRIYRWCSWIGWRYWSLFVQNCRWRRFLLMIWAQRLHVYVSNILDWDKRMIMRGG